MGDESSMHQGWHEFQHIEIFLAKGKLAVIFDHHTISLFVLNLCQFLLTASSRIDDQIDRILEKFSDLGKKLKSREFFNSSGDWHI